MIRPLGAFSKRLSEIAQLVNADEVDGSVLVSGLTNDSKKIERGDLFIAFSGATAHGASFANEASARGAVAILTDNAGFLLAQNCGLPIIVVTNPRKSAGIVSAWFYSEPMRDLCSIGITGTNGKTTTTTLLDQIWRLAERQTGLVGTIETRIGNEVFKSQRTTPESAELQSLIATMRERHVTNLAMEVSSHAIALERMRGAHFSAVAFTNLTQDHLDFHVTMEDYYNTKAALFAFEYADKAFINIDNFYGQKLAKESQIPVISISRFEKSADWHYASVAMVESGFEISIRGSGGILIDGQLKLQGDYNLDNAIMAIAIAVETGVDPLFISASISKLNTAAGRLESVALGQKFLAFVDYAHSPDAVMRVLETCQKMTNGKVIAVLGCGGDRDSLKRPIMGRALLDGSDIAIFTSDNPRSEDPDQILDQMTEGLGITLPNVRLLDRAQAIDYAVEQASAGDVVVILGKGHEQGQEANGFVSPFDDRLALAEAIERMT